VGTRGGTGSGDNWIVAAICLPLSVIRQSLFLLSTSSARPPFASSMKLLPTLSGVSPVISVRSLALAGSVVPDSAFSVFCSPNCSCISAILLQPRSSGGRVALGLPPVPVTAL
jgi:hypothetical protein